MYLLSFALVIKSFGVSVCSGESGSESSSEGSEGNSQNVSSASSFLLCMHYVYTRIIAKENLQYLFWISIEDLPPDIVVQLNILCLLSKYFRPH